MGIIVKDNANGVHGEARRESFVLFTDYGCHSVEFYWKQMDELCQIIDRLKKHMPEEEK